MPEDLVGIGKAVAGISNLTKEVREFILSLLGPSAEEMGQLLADKIKYLRLKNAVRTFQKAQQLLHDQGIEPNAVNLKIFIPILEGSSLEENEDLVSKWAALLASAAAGDPIHPSYPKILGELTPEDARLLDYIYAKNPDEKAVFSFSDLMEKSELSNDQCASSLESLFRTWQGRVPQELTMRGIRTLETANVFLREDWIPYHNTHFAVPAQQQGTTFVPCTGSELEKIFSQQFHRVVGNDNTVHFQNQVLQIEPQKFRYSMARCRVLVCQHLDGTAMTDEPLRDIKQKIEELRGDVIQFRKRGRRTSCMNRSRSEPITIRGFEEETTLGSQIVTFAVQPGVIAPGSFLNQRTIAGIHHGSRNELVGSQKIG